jgi:hypothetical protein
MVKHTILMTVLGLGLTLSLAAQTTTAAPPSPDPPSVNQRLENQKDRIHAGIKDDQLTRSEATKLKAEDAAIRAQERVDRRANGGHLTRHERRQLNRQLNRNSRRIARARHNGRKPRS